MHVVGWGLMMNSVAEAVPRTVQGIPSIRMTVARPGSNNEYGYVFAREINRQLAREAVRVYGLTKKVFKL